MRNHTPYRSTAKNLVAQIAPPNVSNEDVHGSNPASPIVTIKFFKIKYIKY